MKKLLENPWFKLATNVYALIGLFFVVWMVFLDTNSLLIYLNLERKLSELERQKATLERDIALDKKTLLQLNDSIELERYAREKYNMKRKNEDVYLIEYTESAQ
ncbi:MAG: septum formation initiator family protein [Bacteroidetes bacterium]|nr:septum formation initiator family protein [Bacteroidota bacterium]MDA0888168.1 septum formation initiator family protein [Bacteroidota bacterium]MDA1084290.1 septum formation initiator family protein [Bacteroidota bacterium]